MSDLSGWSPWPTYFILTLVVLSENEKCQTCFTVGIFCLDVLQGVFSHDISERCKTFFPAVNTHCSFMCRGALKKLGKFPRKLSLDLELPDDLAEYVQDQLSGNSDE